MGRVPSRGTDQFVLRFPEGLRDHIRDAAERSGRSMNAEILGRLLVSEEYQASIEYLEQRLAAAESNQRHTERLLRNRSMDDLLYNLANYLPPTLLRRMQTSAGNNGHDLGQELLRALEASYPPPQPFSLDWFYDTWVYRIMDAQGEERQKLLDEANKVLQEYGALYFVWETPADQETTPGEIVVSPEPKMAATRQSAELHAQEADMEEDMEEEMGMDMGQGMSR